MEDAHRRRGAHSTFSMDERTQTSLIATVREEARYRPGSRVPVSELEYAVKFTWGKIHVHVSITVSMVAHC